MPGRGCRRLSVDRLSLSRCCWLINGKTEKQKREPPDSKLIGVYTTMPRPVYLYIIRRTLSEHNIKHKNSKDDKTEEVKR